MERSRGKQAQREEEKAVSVSVGGSRIRGEVVCIEAGRLVPLTCAREAALNEGEKGRAGGPGVMLKFRGGGRGRGQAACALYSLCVAAQERVVGAFVVQGFALHD